MKRAVAWLVAAYAVHIVGLVAFWWTWNASFGVAGRTIPTSWDIPLAYLELAGTGIIAGVATTMSMSQRVSLLLAGPQTLSALLCCTWIWSVLLFQSWA